MIRRAGHGPAPGKDQLPLAMKMDGNLFRMVCEIELACDGRPIGEIGIEGGYGGSGRGHGIGSFQ
jgi:hypothetical protein